AGGVESGGGSAGSRVVQAENGSGGGGIGLIADEGQLAAGFVPGQLLVDAGAGEQGVRPGGEAVGGVPDVGAVQVLVILGVDGVGEVGAILGPCVLGDIGYGGGLAGGEVADHQLAAELVGLGEVGGFARFLRRRLALLFFGVETIGHESGGIFRQGEALDLVHRLDRAGGQVHDSHAVLRLGGGLVPGLVPRGVARRAGR